MIQKDFSSGVFSQCKKDRARKFLKMRTLFLAHSQIRQNKEA